MILSKEARKGRRKMRLPLAPPRGAEVGIQSVAVSRNALERFARPFHQAEEDLVEGEGLRTSKVRPSAPFRPPAPSAPHVGVLEGEVGRCLRLLLPLRPSS